jgi:hypothetical protein
MARTAGIFSLPFEEILPMTGALTMTAAQATVNLVIGTSSMPDTLTLPTVAQMNAAQNLQIYVINLTASGGTITVAAPSGNTLSGRSTVVVSAGAVFRTDGLTRWFGF